jgi:hypothetical protein
MHSLFDVSAVQEIIHRIEQLHPESQAMWGKMDVAQMLAHCVGGMQMTTGEIQLPRRFIGRLLSPFIKASYYNNLPFPKGINTDKALVIIEHKSFFAEQENLILSVNKFHKGNAPNCTKAPHPFLGHFTPEQWAKGMYKHLDHHLRQFGV